MYYTVAVWRQRIIFRNGIGCDDKFKFYFDVHSECTGSDSDSSVHMETSEVISNDANLLSQLAKWSVESKIPHNGIRIFFLCFFF